MWALLFLVILSFYSTLCDFCPKECDCDVENGLNRATCVDQNIISVAVGVPKQVQVYSLSRNVISELDNLCFKVSHISWTCCQDNKIYSGMRGKTKQIHSHVNTTIIVT